MGKGGGDAEKFLEQRMKSVKKGALMWMGVGVGIACGEDAAGERGEYRRMLATLRILGRGIGESEFTTDDDRLGKRETADRGQDGGIL